MFFPAAARARFVATDFRQVAPDREIERDFAVPPVTFDRAGMAGALGWDITTRRLLFAQKELRQCCEEILERLQIGSAAEQIV